MKERYILRKENFGGILYDRNNFDFYYIDELGFNIIDNIKKYGINESIKLFDIEIQSDVIDYINELRDMELIKNGLNVSVIKNKLVEKSLSAPVKAYLTITELCNLRCKHCFGDFGFGNEMSFEKVSLILDELEELGVPQISITGGEPLCHPEIYDILKLIFEKGFTVQMTTNGMLIDEKFLSTFSEYFNSCFRISISLDGIEETHDYIRGKGSFSEVMKKIKYLQGNNFNFGINTVIHRYNIDEIDKYLDMLYQNKLINNSFSYIIPTGRAVKNDLCFIDLKSVDWKDKIRKVKESVQKFAMETGSQQFLFGNVVNSKGRLVSAEEGIVSSLLGLERCAAGSYIVTICSNGELLPCVYLEDVFKKRKIASESVFTKTLKEIWDTNEQFSFMRNLEPGEECKKCDSHKNYTCVGGCPAISDEYYNSTVEYDPYCKYWNPTMEVKYDRG